jgi:hypothetical protein
MKLTWFGADTVRVYIGGAILVLNADQAPATIDQAELLSGADQVITKTSLPLVDLATWRPRTPKRLLDEQGEPSVDAYISDSEAILVDATGEPPLLLFPKSSLQLGRWADQAVILLVGNGEELAQMGRAILSHRAPRLLALAGDDNALDHAIPALRDKLDGTGLVALEQGMALEV